MCDKKNGEKNESIEEVDKSELEFNPVKDVKDKLKDIKDAKETKDKEIKEIKEDKEKEIKEIKEKEIKDVKEFKDKEIKEIKEKELFETAGSGFTNKRFQDTKMTARDVQDFQVPHLEIEDRLKNIENKLDAIGESFIAKSERPDLTKNAIDKENNK